MFVSATLIEQRFKSPEGVLIKARRKHLVGHWLRALPCAPDYRFENEGRCEEDAEAAQFLDKNACEHAGSHSDLR